jgi:hypothetical protein
LTALCAVNLPRALDPSAAIDRLTALCAVNPPFASESDGHWWVFGARIDERGGAITVGARPVARAARASANDKGLGETCAEGVREGLSDYLCQWPRDLDDVGLRVAAVHADRVELHEQ